MICQNCGADWPLTTPQMMRFASASHPQGNVESEHWISPAEIDQLGEQITHCPKCPDDRLDSSMYRGGNRYSAGDENDSPYMGSGH